MLHTMPLADILPHSKIDISYFTSEILPNLSAKCVCAGGFLRRVLMGDGQATDIDLWIGPNTKPFLSGGVVNGKVTTVTQEGAPYKVQFIERATTDVATIFDNFDFTVCQLATDGTTFYFTSEAAWHLRIRLLICNAKKILRVKKRVKKYVEYGYFPGDEWTSDTYGYCSLYGWPNNNEFEKQYSDPSPSPWNIDNINELNSFPSIDIMENINASSIFKAIECDGAEHSAGR